MNRRLLTVFVFALAVAGLATFAVYRVMISQVRPGRAAAAAPANKLIVAARDLQVGALIHDGDLSVVGWSGEIPEHAVKTRQDALAWVALFCLVMGMMVSYAKARAEGLGIPCNVGIAERTERLLITLVAAGLTGLGVPYVLAIGFWALAVLSLVTFGQRVNAVRRATAGRPASPVPAGDSWRDHGGEPPNDARAGTPS